MMYPNEIVYDDTICARCGKKLPDEVVPGTVEDEGYCSIRCKSNVGWVHNILNLLDKVEPGRPALSFKEAAEIISRRLFKATDCGICFASLPEYIVLLGYAEGSDAECPPHILYYPFHIDDFWKNVDIANKEGCELFEQTQREPETCS